MKNNDGRDNELDQLLKPLRSAAPNDLQMQKWRTAALMGNTKNRDIYSLSRAKWAVQLVAATLIGIVIGALAFKNISQFNSQANIVAQISLDDATIERSHDNLD